MTSDENIRRRTGRGWEEWFDLLDDWGADKRTHRETARWVAEQLGIGPLVWEAQAVTHSYERVRGLREVGEHADGFAITAQKTIAAPAERVFHEKVPWQLAAIHAGDWLLKLLTVAAIVAAWP